MKKFLALSVSLLLVLSLFASCGKRENQDKVSDEKAEIEKVISDFQAAYYKELKSVDDLKEALPYCSEGGAIYTKILEAISSYESSVDGAVQSIGLSREVAEAFALAYQSSVRKSAKIEIKEVTFEEDGLATAKVTLTLPDERQTANLLMASINAFMAEGSTPDEAYKKTLQNLDKLLENVDMLQAEKSLLLEKTSEKWFIVEFEKIEE